MHAILYTCQYNSLRHFETVTIKVCDVVVHFDVEGGLLIFTIELKQFALDFVISLRLSDSSLETKFSHRRGELGLQP